MEWIPVIVAGLALACWAYADSIEYPERTRSVYIGFVAQCLVTQGVVELLEEIVTWLS